MKKSLQNFPERPFLSVIIPAFNEAENFKRGVLGQIRSYFETQNFSWEAILVNDGSTDETKKLLEDFAKKNRGFRLINKEHGGKLAAIETGVREASGEIILFTDFDQSTPISEFSKFLPHFKKGVDIVIGSRMNKVSKRIGDRPFRYFRSKVLNLIIKIFLFRGISDTQCGFKAGKAKALKNLFDNLQVTKLAKPAAGFMGPFDIELLYLSKKLNYKIYQVPIIWRYFPSKRLSVVAEPAKFLIDIFKIKLFDILGKYEFIKSS